MNMCVDRNGKIWISGYHTLLNINTDTHEIQTFQPNKKTKKLMNKIDIQKMFVDHSNVLWLGTRDYGLYKLNLEKNIFKNSTELLNNKERKLLSSPIVCMNEDKSGSFWLGARDGTLSILKKDILDPNNNSKIIPHILFTSKIKKKIKNKKNEIKRLKLDSNGDMWVGAINGLFKIKYDSSTKKINIKEFDDIKDKYGNTINCIVFAIEEDSQGNIWFGSWGKGLFKLTFNKSNNTYTTKNFNANKNDSTSISSNYITDIVKDKNGNLWIGSHNGLSRLKKTITNSVIFETYYSDTSDLSSLSNNHILDIHKAKNGDLYLGTYGGGIDKLNFTDNDKVDFKSYTIQNGLASNVVTQLKDDNSGNIFAMHISKISKLKPSTGDIVHFDTNDGYNIEQFMGNSMAFSSSGNLVLGGVGGFTIMQLSEFRSQSKAPRITLTEFKINDKPVRVNEEIEGLTILKKPINITNTIKLTHNLNSFEFMFSSMHFSNPSKNRYTYILEGFDDSPHSFSGEERRYAAYSNIPPGSYNFKVNSTNDSGVWSSKAKQIKIIIAEPWHKTYTARFFFILLFITSMYAMFKFRLRQLNLKSKLKLESDLRKKTVEINEMKLSFFTNISHELRTPITLIIGPLQQIMANKHDVDYLNKLHEIMYKNSRRLLTLTNQLLDFRAIESNKVDVKVEQRDLVFFLNEIHNVFEQLSQDKKTVFLFTPAQNSIDAWFDNDKIEKIVYNLLSNAFKFTPPGKKIEMSVTIEKTNEKKFAIIKIEDQGIGIPNDALKNIFDTFFRLDENSKTEQQGSGLGLAYSKKLIKLHNGSIKVQSKVGNGTSFIVKFPILKSDYKDVEIEKNVTKHPFIFTKNAVKEVQESSFETTLYSKPIEHKSDVPTILLVEDNKDLREYLSNYFKNLYKLIIAENGKKGLETAMKNTPDLIISDLMMPEMNGIEMCKTLKNDIHTSHIPIIILTAKFGFDNEKQGLESGADTFVTKPFHIDLLALRVKNILQTRQLWSEKYKTNISNENWKGLTNKLDQQFLKKAQDIIEKNIDNTEYNVEKFTLEIGMSRTALHKKLKSITTQSTSEFIRVIRIKKAAILLTSNDSKIGEVAYMVGFTDPKYFRSCFKKQFGKTPTDFLKTLKK